MRYLISLTLILAALWLAISGVYKPLLLLLGAGSVGLVVWLSHRMEVVGIEHNPGLFSWRLPVYWAWLTWQIVVANIQMGRRILKRDMGLERQIVQVPVDHDTDVARVTFAQSVTLTPGTVSLRLSNQILTAHALTPEAADGLASGTMAKKVRWLEGRS